jgi:hypothetical protein
MNKLPNQITGMNMNELNEFIRTGSPEQMRTMTGKMQMFSANMTGSDACFAKAKRELESLMQEKGMPTANPVVHTLGCRQSLERYAQIGIVGCICSSISATAATTPFPKTTSSQASEASFGKRGSESIQVKMLRPARLGVAKPMW